MLEIVIWYDILFYVDMVRKKLQFKSTTIDVAINQTNVAMKYFEKYRDEEFVPSLDHAEILASEMGVQVDFSNQESHSTIKTF